MTLRLLIYMGLCSSLIACGLFNDKPQHASSDLASKKTIRNTIEVAYRQFTCDGAKVCQLTSEVSVGYATAPANHPTPIHEGLQLVSIDAAIELVNNGLIVAAPNASGHLMDLYTNTVVSTGCYSYIHDQVTELLYLTPSQKSFPSDLQLSLLNVASYGIICVDQESYLSDVGIITGQVEGMKALFGTVLRPLKTSLPLGKYTANWEINVKSRPDFDLNLKRYDDFQAATKPSLWNLWRETNPTTVKQRAASLGSEELVNLYEISVIKGNVAMHRGLEGAMLERLSKQNVVFTDSSGAFNDVGAKTILADFKEMYPRLKEINVDVVQTSRLKDLIPSLGEGKHAFITNAPGDLHRTLVYVHNVEGAKYVYVSDSVGLNDASYLATFGDLATDLKGKGFLFTSDVKRQADSFNCTLFCLKDMATLEKHPEVFESLKRQAVKDTGDLKFAPILPAELLVVAQSVSMLKRNHSYGTMIEGSLGNKVPLDEARNQFKQAFVDPARAKIELAKKNGDSKASMLALEEFNFAKKYYDNFSDFYLKKEVRDLYFNRAAKEGATPITLGTYVEEHASRVETRQINAEITKLRTVLISNIFRRSALD